MRQQVIDGDFVPCRRRIGHVFLYGVVRLQLAALFQQKDAGRSELLRDRSEAELGFRRVRYLPFQVGVAIAFIQNDLPILRYKH